MRTPTLGGVAVALAASAALMIPSTAAVAADDRDPGHTALDATSAESIDARLLAKQNGWEPEATLHYVDESRRFAALAAQLAKEHPTAYAGSRFAERPGAASVVRFVGQPPEEARALIDRTGIPVEVLGDAKYSEAELQERASAVHAHLLKSGFRQVVAATTTEDVVLATVFGAGDPVLPPDLAEGVKVSVSREPVARDEHTLGGAPLLVNGTFNCTSGFTVRNDSTGVTGVATAGHCTGLNQYRQPTDGLTYGLTHQGQHNGLLGDFEWKTTPHIEPAEFFATATQVREVNSVSSLLPENTPSCVYGRSSNARACDQVFSNFVIATVNGITNFFLMAMDNDNTIPGDSGGPWSFATIADGIHKGDITLDGGRRNMWSRAELLPFALGVSVRTQ